ncbi:hypothetical protein CHE218_21240 [Microbacterium sp. che218]
MPQFSQALGATRAEAAGLTTVEQPLQAKGAVAGRLLIRRIDEGPSGAGAAGGEAAALDPARAHVDGARVRSIGGGYGFQNPSVQSSRVSSSASAGGSMAGGNTPH